MWYILQTLLKKVDHIHRAIRFAHFCISFVQFQLEIHLFRLQIAVNAILVSGLLPMKPRFQSNIPSIKSLVNCSLFPGRIKSTELQHCCDIVSNGYNIVPTLQRCVALTIVVANRPVYHQLQSEISAVQLRSVTEIAPTSPFLCAPALFSFSSPFLFQKERNQEGIHQEIE